MAGNPVPLVDFTTLDVPEDVLNEAPPPRIVNVVNHFNIGNTSIPIETVVIPANPGMGYHRQRFTTVKVHYDNMSVLDFSGKNTVIAGCSNAETARIVAEQFVDFYNRIGWACSIQDFFIDNVVCNVRVPFQIDLKGIKDTYGIEVASDYTKFPGMNFKPQIGCSKISFTIFLSGSVIITGAKSYQQSRVAWWWLYKHVLTQFRLDSTHRFANTSSYWREQTDHRLREACQEASRRHLARVWREEPSFNGPAVVPQTPARRQLTSALQTPMTGASHFLASRHQSVLIPGHFVACPWNKDINVSEVMTQLAGVIMRNKPAELIEWIRPHADAGCFPRGIVNCTVAARGGLRTMLARLQQQTPLLPVAEANALMAIDVPVTSADDDAFTERLLGLFSDYEAPSLYIGSSASTRQQ